MCCTSITQHQRVASVLHKDSSERDRAVLHRYGAACNCVAVGRTTAGHTSRTGEQYQISLLPFTAVLSPMVRSPSHPQRPHMNGRPSQPFRLCCICWALEKNQRCSLRLFDCLHINDDAQQRPAPVRRPIMPACRANHLYMAINGDALQRICRLVEMR